MFQLSIKSGRVASGKGLGMWHGSQDAAWPIYEFWATWRLPLS